MNGGDWIPEGHNWGKDYYELVPETDQGASPKGVINILEEGGKKPGCSIMYLLGLPIVCTVASLVFSAVSPEMQEVIIGIIENLPR